METVNIMAVDMALALSLMAIPCIAGYILAVATEIIIRAIKA